MLETKRIPHETDNTVCVFFVTIQWTELPQINTAN